MGMFAYLRCEVPLPDGATSDDRDGNWQTKDLDPGLLDLYVITSAGRLCHQDYDLIPCPREEQTQIGDSDLWVPLYKPINEHLVDLGYHGDIVFYGVDQDQTWHEYRARFTHGQLEGISVVPEEERR